MSKSTDEKVTEDLMETLEDGRKGFADAAEKLADSDQPTLATKFTELSSQRERFAAELEAMAAQYGDDVDESGSVAAAVHRGWMSLKDAIAGSDPKGVLDAAVQGEEHAVKEYEKAVKEELSADLRTTVERQYQAIKAAQTEVVALRDAHS